MANSKSTKKRIRERMAATGETYTAAMRALLVEGVKFSDALTPPWVGEPRPMPEVVYVRARA